MDTCPIIGVSIQGFALLVCVIASLDCIRRQIPPTVVKFRLFTIPYVTIVLATIATSTDPDYVAHGVMWFLNTGIQLILILYMLENFVHVLIGLELNLDMNGLTRVVSGWTFARITILCVYSALAIAFPFDPTNRPVFALRVINAVAYIFFFLPLPVVLLRVCYDLKKHRSQLISNPKESVHEPQPEFSTTRNRRLQRTQWQLALFGVVLLGLIVYATVVTSQALGYLATRLDETWADVSCYTPISGLAVVIALVVTRCANAPLRSALIGADATLAASSRSKSRARSSAPSNVSFAPSIGNKSRRNSADTGFPALAGAAHVADRSPVEPKESTIEMERCTNQGEDSTNEPEDSKFEPEESKFEPEESNDEPEQSSIELSA